MTAMGMDFIIFINKLSPEVRDKVIGGFLKSLKGEATEPLLIRKTFKISNQNRRFSASARINLLPYLLHPLSTFRSPFYFPFISLKLGGIKVRCIPCLYQLYTTLLPGPTFSQPCTGPRTPWSTFQAVEVRFRAGWGSEKLKRWLPAVFQRIGTIYSYPSPGDNSSKCKNREFLYADCWYFSAYWRDLPSFLCSQLCLLPLLQQRQNL